MPATEIRREALDADLRETASTVKSCAPLAIQDAFPIDGIAELGESRRRCTSWRSRACSHENGGRVSAAVRVFARLEPRKLSVHMPLLSTCFEMTFCRERTSRALRPNRLRASRHPRAPRPLPPRGRRDCDSSPRRRCASESMPRPPRPIVPMDGVRRGPDELLLPTTSRERVRSEKQAQPAQGVSACRRPVR
jgi:hypothetical protein